MSKSPDDKDSDEMSEALSALGWEEEKGSKNMGQDKSDKDVEIGKLRENIKDLQESLEKANGKVNSLEQQLQQVTANLQNQINIQSMLEKRIEELNVDLGRRGIELQKQQTQITQMAADAKNTSKGVQAAEISNQLTQKNQIIQEMESKVGELQQNLQNLQEQVNVKNEALAEFSRKIVNLEDTLNSQKIQVDKATQLETEVQKLQQSLRDAQDQSRMQGTQLQDAQNQVKRYTDDIEALSKSKGDKNRLANLEQVITQKDEVIHLKEDEIADLEQSLQKVQQDLTRMQQDAQVTQAAQEKRQKEMDAQKEVFQKQILELQQVLKATTDQAFAKGEELARINAEREKLKESNAGVGNKIQEYENKTIELENENVTLRETIDRTQAEYRGKLQTMEASMAQKEARIAELRDAIDITLHEAESLKQKVPSVKFLKDKSDQLEMSVKQREENIKILEDRVHLKEEVIETLTRENETVKKTLDLKEHEMQAIAQKSKASEVDTGSLREKVQNFEQELARQKKDADKQLVQVREERAKWKAKFDETEAVRGKLVDEIQKLKDQIKEKGEQMKAKDASEIELKKKIKLLRRDLEKKKA